MYYLIKQTLFAFIIFLKPPGKTVNNDNNFKETGKLS